MLPVTSGGGQRGGSPGEHGAGWVRETREERQERAGGSVTEFFFFSLLYSAA